MITTDRGSRVMQPHFGSSLYKLIDRTINDEWVLDFKRYCLQATCDQNGKLWDNRVELENLNIDKIDNNNRTLDLTLTVKLKNEPLQQLNL